MSLMIIDDFPVLALKCWFQKNKREFPWRQQKTPYRVWISEVMLQQTVAKVVISYFEKWMNIFPEVEFLAAASDELVLKHWEGLGYYSRARNLKAGAIDIIQKFQGKLPCDFDSLRLIKGIGPYTANAILSFAFGKKVAPVDGNVLRVLSRYFLVEDSIDSYKGRHHINCIEEKILPQQEPFVVAEALIELGATVCKKSPTCNQCPLKKGCGSYKLSVQKEFPKRTLKLLISSLFRFVAVFVSDHGILLELRKGGLMSGLYEFPYLDVNQEKFLEESPLYNSFFSLLSDRTLEFVEELPILEQRFTAFKAKLRPTIFKIAFLTDHENFVSWDKVSSLTLSSGHRKILHFVREKFGV